jgi:peptidoglycan/LPS O-acetylase OafA/YrhL
MGGQAEASSTADADGAANRRSSSQDGTGVPFVPSLTGLRIFAAGFVYLSHIGAPAGSPALVTAFFKSGYVGVTIFFVLSGFVLALNHFDGLTHPRPGTLWTYAVARVARVYPLYLVVLAYFIVRPAVVPIPRSIWLEHALALQAWDPNLLVAYDLNGPAWSISVELFLYACFPFLVLLFRPLRRSPGAILAVAFGVVALLLALALWFTTNGGSDLPWTDPASDHRWLYRTPLLRVGDFSLGMLAALLFLLVRNRPGIARIGRPMAIVAAVVIVALMSWPAHVTTAFSWDGSYVIPVVLLLFGLAVSPRGGFTRFLAHPLIVRFGEASYAFYLAQAAIIGALGAGAWKQTLTLRSAAWELMILGFLLALSVGLHELVEGPARRAVRRGGDAVLRWTRRNRIEPPPPSRPVPERVEPQPTAP